MVHIWDATGSFGLRGTIDHSLGSVYSLAVTRQFIIVGRFFTLLTVTYATPWIKGKVKSVKWLIRPTHTSDFFVA